MQVLVATSHETTNFISITEESNPLITSKLSLEENICDRLLSLSNKVKFLVSDSERCHGQVPELDLFVQHTHGGMEATFDVVLYVVSTDLELVHEARVVGARTSCENRGHDIILVKREAHIRDGDIVVVECQ